LLSSNGAGIQILLTEIKEKVVENDDIVVLIVIVNNPRKMCCVFIWERVVNKIRERVCEEEILQLYRRQVEF
jgi:hypothetical protein